MTEHVRDQISRATFYNVLINGMGSVKCPRCDSLSTWSVPDDAPLFCWDCGLEFRFGRTPGEKANKKAAGDEAGG